MRRLRYQVATSLDGYIAGPGGEFDWIVMDPDIDFAALMAQFDTAVMGRKTFLVTEQQGGAMPGLDVVVFSRTLRPADYPAVSIVDSDPAAHVRSLKARPGKDIWLFGGGELLRTTPRVGPGRYRGTSRGAGASWRRYPDALAAGLASPTDVEHASRLPEVRNRAARVRGQPVRYRALATVPTGSATSGRASS